MSNPPTLDAPALPYASQPLPGAITLLRSADTTEFLLRPMPRTLLALFIPPLIAIILASPSSPGPPSPASPIHASPP
ncbi:MAG TPA: hypothetical protein VHQ47_15540 [Phycisphaerae bacterium]|nr:hypothetical protein [Phycisphaerae bacterium]